MLNINTHKVDTVYSEGFGVKITEPFLIEVDAGSMNYIEKYEDEITINVDVVDEEGTVVGTKEVPKTVIKERTETDNYPAFSFEIEPDPVFEVIYDVYILGLPSVSGDIIHLDRTVISEEFPVAHYTGEDTIKLCLISMIVPPNCASLNDADIRVSKVVREDAGLKTE